MNKTEKWIISGLAGFFVLLLGSMFGYLIHQNDNLDMRITRMDETLIDLRVQVAALGTKMEDHIQQSEKQARIQTPNQLDPK